MDKILKRVLYVYSLVCFFAISIYFIFVLKHKKSYEEQKHFYTIFPYSHKVVDEDPIQIISQFRQDDKKQGIVQGEFSIQGKIHSVSEKINGSIHGASKGTPAVDESGIYVGADDGWFYKFNHQGELIWKVYFAKTWQGIHGTALLSKKYLWIGAYNGVLYCIKKSTGEIIWSIDLGGSIGASPSFYKGQIIISVEILRPRAMGFVASVSARDGRLNWKTPITDLHIHSSVAIHKEKAYGVTGSNNSFLTKIELHSGKVLWRRQLKGPIKSTPLIYKGKIYVTNWGDQFVALDEEDGYMLWSVDIKSGSQSSPTLLPDRELLIFAVHKAGSLFAISAIDGSVIWVKPLHFSRSIASGVSFFSKKENRYLFLYPCSAKALCVVDPDTGNFLKQIPIGFLLTGSFSVFKQYFYMSMDNGGVMAIH